MVSYLHENAREFYFLGNNIGILLIHGFNGSPSEMRYLGEYLKEKGFSVKGLLLKGHGTTQQDMKKTDYKDWISSAEQGYLELAQSCDEIFVIGLSMGGVLAFHIAQKYDVKGIISLATPIRIMKLKYCTSKLAEHLYVIINRQSKTIKQKDPFILGYDKASIKSILSFFKLISIIKTELYKIGNPVLIIQSYQDGTVHPSSANYIYSKIASIDKSIIFLHKSGHIITCDCEKEQVFQEIFGFLSRRCSQYNSDQHQEYSKTMEV